MFEDLSRIIDHQLYLATQQTLGEIRRNRRGSDAGSDGGSGDDGGGSDTSGEENPFPTTTFEVPVRTGPGQLTGWDRGGGHGGGEIRGGPEMPNPSGEASSFEETIRWLGFPDMNEFVRSVGEILSTGSGRGDETQRGDASRRPQTFPPAREPGPRPPAPSVEGEEQEDIYGATPPGRSTESQRPQDSPPPPPPLPLPQDSHRGRQAQRQPPPQEPPERAPQRSTQQPPRQPPQPERKAPDTSRTNPGPPPDPNLLSTIASLTLLCEDVPELFNFYQRVFDATVVATPSADETTASLAFNNGSLRVDLLDSNAAPRQRLFGLNVHLSRRGDQGRRFMLGVRVADVDVVYAKLQAVHAETDLRVEGLTAPSWKRAGGGRMVTFCDMAGHCWEVWQGI